jgi:hypothetical protein
VLRHNITNDAGEGFPLFFALLLEVFEKVVVWLKNRESFDSASDPIVGCIEYQYFLNFENTILEVTDWSLILYDNRLN